MNKSILLPAIALFPVSLLAQSSIDAYNLSQSELRGTARFMSMAGAFTALGGDLSTLNQNPAGIGIYRGSDIALTLDINMMDTKSSGIPSAFSVNNTHADVNNFGYVGTLNIGNSVVETISWGLSYGRRASFERHYRGAGMPLQTSLSNYIALVTEGIDPADMNFGNMYNPYETNINWLSTLAYSGAIINPIFENVGGQNYPTSVYDGLFQYDVRDSQGNVVINSTTGVADMLVNEKGYVDEYAINFGGNLANTLYWGIGLGITDLSYEQSASYVETLADANVPSTNSDGEIVGIEAGDCDYELANYKKITGTGVNFKFGLIYKPVNELRIGFAIHTPTYYSLNTVYQADLAFGASNGYKSNQSTDVADFSWNLRSPWRMMFGLAGVIGGRAIISADYEYEAYQSMETSDSYGDFDYYNADVKDYFKSANTVRVGAEFRVTPQFSIRAGYGLSTSAVNDVVKDSNVEVYTSGRNPAYTLNDDTRYITAGLGYRIGGFYADLTYVNKHLTSTYRGFTSFKEYDGYWTDGPSAKLTSNSNRLIVTLGYKF